MIELCIAAWLLTGTASFVFWWTKEFDLTTCEIPLVVLGSLMGPISFLAGWGIHGDHKDSCQTILRKRP